MLFLFIFLVLRHIALLLASLMLARNCSLAWAWLIATTDRRYDEKRQNNVFVTGERTLSGALANTCLLLGLIIHVSIPMFAHVVLCKCQQMNIFYKIHKNQIHHVIFYLECNLQFPFFFLLFPLIFSYLNNVKWIEYVLMTTLYLQFFMRFF